jgi:putative CocE/NonD family hydrolase
MRERTNEIEVVRDVKVPMRDGTVLLADVFHPVGDDGIVEDAPTILERTPYGRRNIGHIGAGPQFARRGYRYVIQACRGTDGSSGHHTFFGEADDGRDTADWIAEQPWFDGRLGSYGASYMGFTQWALASTKPPYLQAMAVALSTSMRQWSWFCGDSVALELIVSWDLGAMDFGKPDAVPVVTDVTPEAVAKRMEELRVAYAHLPVGDIIRFMKGEDYPFFLHQLGHASLDDPTWSVVDFREFLPDWTIPTLLVDGWHDYPLPGVIRDYQVLRDAPAPAQLRIGAGGHLGGGGEGGMTDASLDWFDTYLLGRDGLLDHERPVAVHIQGDAPEWRRYENWPPPATPTNWYLQPAGGLTTTPPPDSVPDTHPYDPADPTPAVGGIGMISGGMAENTALETRDDVLVYTSEVLTEPLVLLGPVHAEIHLATTNDHTDVFVRLCDVHPDGSSFNICDALQRYTPVAIERGADGVFVASIDLWPAGHRFGAGHRLRVQVSGGAHPTYARNLGTDEPLATAVRTVPTEHTIHHDPAHPSHLVLPHAANTVEG